MIFNELSNNLETIKNNFNKFFAQWLVMKIFENRNESDGRICSIQILDKNGNVLSMDTFSLDGAYQFTENPTNILSAHLHKCISKLAFKDHYINGLVGPRLRRFIHLYYEPKFTALLWKL